MDGITDCAYREMCKAEGDVDLLYTEFQNVHGLSLAVPKLWNAFRYTEFQRPILAQIYGHEIEYFFPAALLCYILGFDGVDVNMGCPAKKISDRGAGAGLIRTPEIAKQIIAEVKRARSSFQNDIIPIISKLHSYDELLENLEILKLAAISDLTYRRINSTYSNPAPLPSINWSKLLKLVIKLAISWEIDFKKVIQNSTNLTVSVKTRIGYDKPETETWIPQILEAKPDLIALHGRTLKQLYAGSANWEEIANAVELCQQGNIPLLANGDIGTAESANSCVEVTKANGLLIGRGSYGKPEIFRQIRNALNSPFALWEVSTLAGRQDEAIDKFEQIMKHCELFDNFNPLSASQSIDPVSGTGSIQTNFFSMRKVLCWYIKDIPNASELRKQLVLCSSSQEVKQVLYNSNATKYK